MQIAFVASEAIPYAKTGGLADVSGALPRELEKCGHKVKLFLPKYYSINEQHFPLIYMDSLGEIPVRVNHTAHNITVYKGKLPQSVVEVYFINCPHFFHRHSLYTNDHDEDERFLLFNKAVIETIQRLSWKPDIIHCNDWQTGLIPLLIKENYSWDILFNGVSTVFTIHNIGYQGLFKKETAHKAELKEEHLYDDTIVHNGLFSFLKSAISFADKINTVSETYAKELLTAEYGAGLNKSLAKRLTDYSGIINGVDYNIWNPETDKNIPFNYSLRDLSGKQKNKEFLLKKINLPFDSKTPLIGMVSRMAAQKGFDLFASSAEYLMSFNAQWVVLGSGEKEYEQLFLLLQKEYPQKLAVSFGYNNELAHLIEAASDIFLMPSQYEPCGLNQIYSLKYGTVPVVRKTGGLADTVRDWDELLFNGSEDGTGFSFEQYDGYALTNAFDRALKHFQNKSVWSKIQLNGMMKDFSWNHSAEQYSELYKKAVK